MTKRPGPGAWLQRAIAPISMWWVVMVTGLGLIAIGVAGLVLR
jgi:hypothetical protein